MLGETIATLRKKQGLSQQELADRLHVVRQTISKWEKNLSVPDADALVRLADALDVTVPQLLGETITEEAQPSDIAAALSRINEQLAVQNRRRSRIWKVVAWVLGILLLVNVLNIASAAFFYSVQQDTFVEQTAATYEVVENEELSVE
ncbi:MAG: helix-turn-helix transcriptional regulator [Clostridia bacterium]|nr:helix-turn-helix transcriptional regulator [Clostridia bacterium]